MKRPSPDVVKSLAIVSRQHPDLVAWLGEWMRAELEMLPNVKESVAVAQGRCQVLRELHKLVVDAPDLAAERK